MRHGRYFKEPTSEAKDGLVTKVSGTHPLDEESPQNRSLAQPTTSEILKESTTNSEFSQVSLKTVEADHEDEWFSVPEPFDGPDYEENDWLILDASELWDGSIQGQDDYTWSWVSVEKEIKGGSVT